MTTSNSMYLLTAEFSLFFYFFVSLRQAAQFCMRRRLWLRSLTMSKVLLDSKLSIEKSISQTSKSSYYQLLRISSVRKYIYTEATVKPVTNSFCHASTAAVLSFLAFLLPLIHSLRCIQNCAARLILKKRKADHITPLFHSLYLLPIPKNSVQDKHSLL